jgi:NADH:ubiquinone oxidoreductase subunit 4 (subunit M)
MSLPLLAIAATAIALGLYPKIVLDLFHKVVSTIPLI